MKKIAAGLVAVLISSGTAFGHNWIIANFQSFQCEPAVNEGMDFRTPFVAYEAAKERQMNPSIFIASRIDGKPFEVQMQFSPDQWKGPVILFWWRDMNGRGMAACKKMIKTRFDPSGIN